MIYFDNAATTLKKPDGVAQAVSDAIMNLGNAGRGAYDASLHSMRMAYETRELLNELFNGEGPEQIAFMSNATEALNTAINGMIQSGDHVVTTVMEHNSVLRPLYLKEQTGVALTVLPLDENGLISSEAFEEAIRPDTEAIVCTHASNVTGTALNLYRIGEVCKRHGLHFIVDASQSAGILPIDMQAMNIDALCFTGHKGLFGPQGTGGICLRKGITIRPLKVGGSGIHSFDKEQPQFMPELLEAGTINAHGIAGLNASLKYLKKEGLEKLYTKEALLTKTFYEGVRRIEGVRVYGNFDQEKRAPVVSLNIRDEDAGKVSEILWEDYGIATRAGAHCAPLMHEALETTEQGVVRFSFSSFNTIEEIKQGIEAIREFASE
ncbi:MAG: aminotransferase class V-fold PLP-dependent enzyme [Anaerobutyricum soehngenii]|nr:aminotransferase class V-fold PLP-dependent enzyme [Anaerobutyricum soehngenii]